MLDPLLGELKSSESIATKIKYYLPLLVLLSSIALSKKLPSDNERGRIHEEYLKIVVQDKNLVEEIAKNYCESDGEVQSFLEKISHPKSVEDLKGLVEIISDCLMRHLGNKEFDAIDKESYSPGLTHKFLIAWNAECDTTISNYDTVISLLMGTLIDHPLRGYAHVCVADLFKRKLNEIVRSDKEKLLNIAEVEVIFAFLHHCAMARTFGFGDKTPKQFEENVLKCLLSYIIGKGWIDLQVTICDLRNKEIFCGKDLIEWLRKCFERLAVGEDLKIVMFKPMCSSDSNNLKEPDQKVEVVLLEDKIDNTLEQSIIQKYPNALVTQAPSFLSFEERPFQLFLKSCLIGNLEFIGNFEDQIKEIGDRYRSKKIDLSHAKKEAKTLFLKEIKGANQFKLLFLFNFVKNNPLCDFIHEQRNERWDRGRINLFGCVKKDGESQRQTKSTQSNRWWNTATFSAIVKKIQNKWIENEKEGQLISLDREALLDFDCGNLFKSQCYSKASYRPTSRS